MRVLSWLDDVVKKVLPFTGVKRSSVRDGFGNEVDAEISPEMQAYLEEQRANELPDDIPELSDGLDNERVGPNP